MLLIKHERAYDLFTNKDNTKKIVYLYVKFDNTTKPKYFEKLWKYFQCLKQKYIFYNIESYYIKCLNEKNLCILYGFTNLKNVIQIQFHA